MVRHLSLLLLLAALGASPLGAGEAPAATTDGPAPDATGYDLAPGSLHIFRYHCEAVQRWRSAGDELRFTTTRDWLFMLKGLEQGPDTVTLLAKIYRIEARHRGPGVDVAIDSRAQDEDNPPHPLLAGLLAQDRVPLTLTVERSTGTVLAVDGWEQVVERAQALFPAGFATRKLTPEATVVFGEPALARRWTAILSLPRDTPEQVPLGHPLSTAVERRWQGDRFTLHLPQETASVSVHAQPKPVTMQITGLEGSGEVVLDEGALLRRRTQLAFTVTGEALGQGVAQTNEMTITVGRWTATTTDPAPESDDDQPPAADDGAADSDE
ncbi:MAG: hypothetical protein ACOCZK_02240 [Planctomycetota bacterium]